MSQISVLETVIHRTPLVVRLIDAATGSSAGSGFRVTAARTGSVGKQKGAFETRSGVFAFEGIKGMRHIEYPTNDSPGGPDPAGLVVFVTDLRGRYLPAAMAVELPTQQVVDLTLFAAPSSGSPAGWAAVRGSVIAGAQPAAFALVSATVVGGAGTAYVGVSDHRGEFLVPIESSDAQVDLALRWSPGSQRFFRFTSRGRVEVINEQPADLAALLASPEPVFADPATITAQQAVTIVQPGGEVTETFRVQMRLGRGLTVRTGHPDARIHLSVN